jgi:hypothetical protein
MATQIDIGINVDGDMDGYVIGGHYVNGDDIDIQND